jgi:tetratricopeptide (TPR) repeat protein
MAAAAGAAAAPAQAQKVRSSVQLGGVTLSVTDREAKALTDLGAALRQPEGVQDRALAAARRAAQGRDARYWLALLELEIGRQRLDDAMRAAALDLLIASPMTGGAKLPGYLDVRGGIAFRAGDLETAKSHWTRLLALKPNDPDVIANLAQIQVAQGDSRGASELMERAIAGRAASGAPSSAIWYRQRLSIARQAGAPGPAAAAGRALVEAYPSAEHWRAALVVYRQLAAPQGAFEIDLLRLHREVGALTRADEYQRLAQLLKQAGQPGEAKAVLSEGVGRGLLDAAGSPTREIIAEVERALPQERARLAAPAAPPLAESLVGAGRFDEAAALYRAMLAKGGGEPGEVNSRLGRALTLAGRKGEAEAAFRASGFERGALFPSRGLLAGPAGAAPLRARPTL